MRCDTISRLIALNSQFSSRRIRSLSLSPSGYRFPRQDHADSFPGAARACFLLLGPADPLGELFAMRIGQLVPQRLGLLVLAERLRQFGGRLDDVLFGIAL